MKLGNIGKAIASLSPVGNTLMNMEAVEDASKAQLKGNREATAEIRRQYEQTRSDLSPYREAGESSLAATLALLGLSGADVQDKAIDSIRSGPFFDVSRRSAMENIARGQAATGGLRGGDIQSLFTSLEPELLMQYVNNQIGNLGQINTIGQNAAAQTGTFGANASSQIASNYQDRGAIKSENILGQQRHMNDAYSRLLNIGTALATGGASLPFTGGISGNQRTGQTGGFPMNNTGYA